MQTSRRLVLSVSIVILLIVAVVVARWYDSQDTAARPSDDGVTLAVTDGGDRGPGTLREALFIAAAASTEVTISIEVPRIALTTPLPPLLNAIGMTLVSAEPGAEIDAEALGDAVVLDVSGTNVTIGGLAIRNCNTAILLRAESFRLESATIEGCDVGLDVAENAAQILIEGNRFADNRIGVRFSGSNSNATVVKNEFAGHGDAGIWAVRSTPEAGGAAISIRDNRFTVNRVGIVAGNVRVLAERNDLIDSRESALQIIGAGAVVRGNRVQGGASMGIVAENAESAVIEDNEIEGLDAYGIMVKGSADTLVRNNRVHNSGFGLAFVLARTPSSAIGNTIIEPRFNGIDVIGDSPILRDNTVLRPRGLALKVIDYDPAEGLSVRSQPFLEGNNFEADGSGPAAAPRNAAGTQ